MTPLSIIDIRHGAKASLSFCNIMNKNLGFNDFLSILSLVTSDNEVELNKMHSEIMEFMRDDIVLFLHYSGMAILQDLNNYKICYVALSSIKNALTPSRSIPKELIAKKWILPINNEMRECVKESVIQSLISTEMQIHNIAAVSLALIIQLEMCVWTNVFEIISENLPGNDELSRFRLSNVLYEIFEHRIFDNSQDSLPFQFDHYIECLKVSLCSDSEETILNVLRCLRSMILRIPMYFNEDLVIFFLDSLHNLVGTKNKNLFLEVHLFVYDICKAFYDQVFYVVDRIISVLVIGFSNSIEFLPICFQFWSEIWFFECNIVTYEKSLTNYVSESLIESLHNALANVNDPIIKDIDFDESIIITLKCIFQSNPDVIFSKNCSCISKEFEKNDHNSYLSILKILVSMCSPPTMDYIYIYLVESINMLRPVYQSGNNQLRIAYIDFLSTFISIYHSFLEIPSDLLFLFSIISETVSSHTILSYHSILLLSSMCESGGPAFIKDNYRFLHEFLMISINNDYLCSSDHSDAPFTCFRCMITNCHKDLSPDLKDLVVQLLSFSNNTIDKTDMFDSKSTQSRRMGIFSIITSITQFLGGEIADCVELIMDYLAKVQLNGPIDIVEELYIEISALCIALGPDMIQYHQLILQSINHGLMSNIPSQVKLAALSYADFFAAVSRSGAHLIGSEFEIIANIIDQFELEDPMELLPSMIFSVGSVLKAMEDLTPENISDSFYLILQHLCNNSVSIIGQNDHEYYTHLYFSLLHGYRGLIISIDQFKFKDPASSRLFRSSVVGLIDKIWEYKLVDIFVMSEVCELVKYFVKVFGNTVNLAVKRKSIRGIIRMAFDENDKDLQSKALNISQLIEFM